jgi:phosphonate transport system permease protein
MALTVISLGMLGRFFYEAIDRVRQGPIDAVTATGVNKLLIIIYGILPQILTEIFDYSIYRFECNLRASTYIGIVGAGGMGFQIILSLRLMQYQDLLTGIIVVYILINSAEMIGKFLRQKFFH